MNQMSAFVINRLLYEAVGALNKLNEALGNQEPELTLTQQHDLEMAFKRIQYKTEKAA